MCPLLRAESGVCVCMCKAGYRIHFPEPHLSFPESCEVRRGGLGGGLGWCERFRIKGRRLMTLRNKRTSWRSAGVGEGPNLHFAKPSLAW